jgi:hypothetical protein
MSTLQSTKKRNALKGSKILVEKIVNTLNRIATAKNNANYCVSEVRERKNIRQKFKKYFTQIFFWYD